MAVIDFRVRPPFKGFLDMVMYANPDRRNRHRATGLHRDWASDPPPRRRKSPWTC